MCVYGEHSHQTIRPLPSGDNPAAISPNVNSINTAVKGGTGLHTIKLYNTQEAGMRFTVLVFFFVGWLRECGHCLSFTGKTPPGGGFRLYSAA